MLDSKSLFHLHKGLTQAVIAWWNLTSNLKADLKEYETKSVDRSLAGYKSLIYSLIRNNKYLLLTIKL